jgi:hypothetical protein
VRVAIEDGYLVNLEQRRGRPARITLGDPLPEERAVLPHPDALAGERGGGAIVSPRSSLHECTSPSQATQGGGLLQSPRSSLHECTGPSQATADPRAGLPLTPLVPLASPTAEPAATQGAFAPLRESSRWRPAESPPTEDSPQAALEPWQQSILDEFDP